MQDRRRQFDEIFLQRAAGPYMWVKNGPDSPETPLPVFPDQLTSSDRPGWSVSCQQHSSEIQTFAVLYRMAQVLARHSEQRTLMSLK
jgi:hypothetical protein